MMGHLWTSTIVLAAALAAAKWTPRLTARTRHAILFLGMLKLLIPPIPLPAPRGVIDMRFLAPPRPLLLAATPAHASHVRGWLLAGSLLITLLLFARAIVQARRLRATALRFASAPSARETRAFDAARRRLGLRRAIDLIRSPVTEAPALIGIVWPMVVVPEHRCDDLADDELEAILAHECAHARRRDNLLGAISAVVAALFWFHPLVWLAQRALARTREQACDEAVADSGALAATYLAALTKVCRAAFTPSVPAVSCMASPHLSERMNHLMRYTDSAFRALSHRLVVIVAAIVIGASTLTTVLAASADSKYVMTFKVTPASAGNLRVTARVTDSTTNEVVSEPTMTFPLGQSARVSSESGDRKIIVTVRSNADGSGSANLRVLVQEKEVQSTDYAYTPAPPPAASPGKYSGEPITLNLKDADVRDVMRTFAQLTGSTISVDPDIHATVSADFKQIPWDEAFDRLLAQAGLHYHVAGKTIFVTK